MKYLLAFLGVGIAVAVIVNVTFMLIYEMGSACILPITADVLC